jgi:hypothetical protein
MNHKSLRALLLLFLLIHGVLVDSTPYSHCCSQLHTQLQTTVLVHVEYYGTIQKIGLQCTRPPKWLFVH